VSLEEDYALVRAALIEWEIQEGWDLEDERHALARIWHALRKAGLGSTDALATAIAALPEQDTALLEIDPTPAELQPTHLDEKRASH
jgi:hypothetical protein